MKTKITILVLSIFIILPFFSQAQEPASAYSFTWPLDKWSFDINAQKFGAKRAKGVFHLGDDVSMPASSPVYAIATGIIKHIGIHTNFGTVILIEHVLPTKEKIVSLYGHLGPNTKVNKGQFVNKNQIIGYIGNSAENGGWSEHLHFGIRKGPYININHAWVYFGVSTKDKLDEWYNPTEFLWYRINNPEIIAGKIITAPNYPGRSHIRIFNKKGSAISSFDFFAYPPKNQAGFQIALGDINNDQNQELLISVNKKKPVIKIFDKNSQDFIASFQPFSKKYKGKINLITANLDSNQQEEIIVAKSKNQSSKIKVFSYDPDAKNFFQPTIIPNPFNKKSGANLGSIDLNDDNQKEIIATPANKKKSVLKFYNGQTWQILNKRIFKKTNAKLTVADIDNDGKEEILAASQQGIRSKIKIINQDGSIRKKNIKPFSYKFKKGINISTTDFNEDGIQDIIVSLAKSAPPKIKVIQYKQKLVISSFLAYDSNFMGGVNIVGIK